MHGGSSYVGRSFHLVGGLGGPVSVYVGAPPTEARGRRVARRQLEGELRAWATAGGGPNYYALVELYEALGAALPRPPQAADLARMADALVDAVARDHIVALEAPLHDAPMPLPDDAAAAAPALPARVQEVSETTWFSLTVLDEVGAALDGLKIAYSVRGERRTVTTDGGGKARLDGVQGGFASANITNLDAVREKLRPRWKEPRTPKRFDDPKIVFREIGAAVVEPVALQNETPTTLVITPYFRCHEIPGAHFAFGRSFVLRDAITNLAGLAEEISGEEGHKGMIFGHTDKAGPVLLNKELSERRAKAIYAIFTHDAAAWEELWTGSADKKGAAHWREKWGPFEAKHMLNSLAVKDREGNGLKEDDLLGAPYGQALKKFQSGDYEEKPGEQAPLPATGKLDKATRKELFLAYAKKVTRKPAPKDRLSKIGAAPYMGCGLFNPLSITAKDAQSRRVVVFVYDPAAEPRDLPCKLGDLGPCNQKCGAAPTAPAEDGSPPYRCSVYKKIAASCPCNGGADLSHDLIVRIPFPLDVVSGFKHELVVESDDGTIQRRAKVATDARALNEEEVEIYFSDLPPAHHYRMRAEGVDPPYQVFAFTEFEKLSNLSRDVPPGEAAGTSSALALNDAPPDDPIDPDAEGIA